MFDLASLACLLKDGKFHLLDFSTAAKVDLKSPIINIFKTTAQSVMNQLCRSPQLYGASNCLSGQFSLRFWFNLTALISVVLALLLKPHCAQSAQNQTADTLRDSAVELL